MVCSIFVSQRVFVCVPTILERVASEANVKFARVVDSRFDVTLVDDVFFKAISLKWTDIILTTVTRCSWVVSCRILVV